jgi:hypothetical protein
MLLRNVRREKCDINDLLLFAKYLRDEKESWIPRIAILS